MITREQYLSTRLRAANLIKCAGIVVSDAEIERMDVADFGLGNLEIEGAQIISLIDTKKIAMRVIALFPRQTEPEHWHIGFDKEDGKEETIRLISGKLLLYLPGEDIVTEGIIPAGKQGFYTARNETIMRPCDTVTILPGIKHWFQADENGAIFYSISTTARDASDLFTDPHVMRITKIIEV